MTVTLSWMPLDGSGTTAAVAEKLGRRGLRWIAASWRFTRLKSDFLADQRDRRGEKDDRTEPERVEDWNEHLKNAPGVMLITEKARKGECEVTLELLHDLAALIQKHGLLKKDAALSLVCPGRKIARARRPVGRCRETAQAQSRFPSTAWRFGFRSSPPEKGQKRKSRCLPRICALPCRDLRHGGDQGDAVGGLPAFCPETFRRARSIGTPATASTLDGYIGTDSALIWNFPRPQETYASTTTM